MRAALFCSCLLLACSRNSTPIDSDQLPPAAAAPANAPPAAMPQAPAQPSAAQPSAAQPSAAVAPPTGPARAGGLMWTAAQPLVARTPKSSMRAAEYGIQGDAQSELSVFYFGPGQGGAVDANVTRWLGQIAQPDGSDTAAQAKRDESKINGIAVATVEAHGTYSGGMAMPGMPASGPIPNAIMLGAIATGPQGPVFFKLVGPAEAVERARPAFATMIASLHPE
jgi:hypothetical protein